MTKGVHGSLTGDFAGFLASHAVGHAGADQLRTRVVVLALAVHNPVAVLVAQSIRIESNRGGRPDDVAGSRRDHEVATDVPQGSQIRAGMLLFQRGREQLRQTRLAQPRQRVGVQSLGGERLPGYQGVEYCTPQEHTGLFRSFLRLGTLNRSRAVTATDMGRLVHGNQGGKVAQPQPRVRRQHKAFNVDVGDRGAAPDAQEPHQLPNAVQGLQCLLQ